MTSRVLSPAEQATDETALLQALHGVELTGADEEVLRWLSTRLESTQQVLVSWLRQVRQLGYQAGVDRVMVSVQRRLDEAYRAAGGGERP